MKYNLNDMINQAFDLLHGLVEMELDKKGNNDEMYHLIRTRKLEMHGLYMNLIEFKRQITGSGD